MALSHELLITADLHYREHWFRWLIEQGPDYDLVCIAGDLLDMFRAEPRTEQAIEVSRLLRELATLTRVAVCSGNHDNAGRQVTADRALVYDWFPCAWLGAEDDHGSVTRVVDDLIVTTVPGNKNQSGRTGEPRSGSNAETGGWCSTRQGASGEESEAAALLMAYRPGHTHAYPYSLGNSWAQKIGEINVFVPGPKQRRFSGRTARSFPNS